ncbi:hypothetical protein GALL_444690 [mine drainage metagenome]|uniref:Uncharacterized protein n=1 Tax=mine drainage metagenome TaxID=410659 RepID=A0A1J5Q8T1_9ZZZZ
MMQAQPQLTLGRARPPRDHHKGRFLSVGLGDGIDHVQRSGAIGHHRYAKSAADASGGISSIAHAGFMAERMPRQDATFGDYPEERQNEIAGDTKDPVGSAVLEGIEKGSGKGWGHGGLSGLVFGDCGGAGHSTKGCAYSGQCAAV